VTVGDPSPQIKVLKRAVNNAERAGAKTSLLNKAKRRLAELEKILVRRERKEKKEKYAQGTSRLNPRKGGHSRRESRLKIRAVATSPKKGHGSSPRSKKTLNPRSKISKRIVGPSTPKSTRSQANVGATTKKANSQKVGTSASSGKVSEGKSENISDSMRNQNLAVVHNESKNVIERLRQTIESLKKKIKEQDDQLKDQEKRLKEQSTMLTERTYENARLLAELQNVREKMGR